MRTTLLSLLTVIGFSWAFPAMGSVIEPELEVTETNSGQLKAWLSWGMPTEVDGQPASFADFSYSVLRNGIEVDNFDMFTTFSEEIPTELTRVKYSVKVIYKGNLLDEAELPPLIVSLPYSGPSCLDDDFSYTDSDKDATILSPFFFIRKGTAISLTATIESDAEGCQAVTYITTGTHRTAISTDLCTPQDIPVGQSVSLNGTLMIETSGVYRIGIRRTSGTGCPKLIAFSLDGEMTLPPGTPSDVKVIPAPGGLCKATISFSAPSIDRDGNVLEKLSKIVVTRNSVEIGKIVNPRPGQTGLSIIDENAPVGTITYKVVAYNDGGPGQGAAATAYIGPDEPTIINGPNVIVGDSDYTISWSPAIAGHDGFLDPGDLQYIVYAVYPEDNFMDPVATVKGNITSVTLDDEFSAPTYLAFLVEAFNSVGSSLSEPSETALLGSPHAIDGAVNIKADNEQRAGLPLSVTIEVYNLGRRELPPSKVDVATLGIPSMAVESVEFPAIPNGGVAVMTTQVATNASFPANLSLSADLRLDTDLNSANNTSSTTAIIIANESYPGVTGLSGEITNNCATLTWVAPDLTPMTVTESFENCRPCGISDTDMPGWTLVDGDGQPTFYVGAGAYENASSPKSFMVVNPSELGWKSEACQPYTGNQMIVSWSAQNDRTNDLIISPRVAPGSEVSFRVKSMNSDFGYDEFVVMKSGGSTNPADFEDLTDVMQANEEWTLVTVTMPDDASRFAINGISFGCLGLCVDDVAYTADMDLDLIGYNIYRDNILTNDQPISSTNAEIPIDSNESHSYYVTAVYEQGESPLLDSIVLQPETGLRQQFDNLHQAIAITYYDLTGRRLADQSIPYGPVIEVTIYSDGSSVSRKVLR